MSIVENSVKATAKRITYGIEIKVGSFTLNEWGLHESQAKEVNELLVLNGDKPIVVDGVTFSLRECRRYRASPSKDGCAAAENGYTSAANRSRQDQSGQSAYQRSGAAMQALP